MGKLSSAIESLEAVKRWAEFCEQYSGDENPVSTDKTDYKNIVGLLDYAINAIMEEVNYQKYLEQNRINGSLCGHMVMSADQFIEHKISSDYKRQYDDLRKLSRNPAFTVDVKDLLRTAAHNITALLYWRDAYMAERDKNNGK